jgi:starch synthase
VKIAHLSAEVAPWCKSGGLGDVLGALPQAQARAGAQVAVFLPLHREALRTAHRRGLSLTPTGVDVIVNIAGQPIGARFLAHTDPSSPGLTTYLLDCPRFFDRDGLYVDPATGRDYSDNGLRYPFFCQAVLQAVRRLMGEVPDVIHAHDWQTAVAPIYLRHAAVPTVLTIHNLAYQGVFPKDILPAIGLDWSVFTPERAEYHDHLALLKGGIADASAVTTVSPTYAREIGTAQHGQGLHDFIRAHARRLRGILNGIDAETWSPEHDPHIAQQYSTGSLDGKWACRQALQREFGLSGPAGEPLLGAIARFTGQKGIDLIADIVPHLERLKANLVVLGTGSSSLEDRMRRLARRHRRLAVRIDFDSALSHRITAGCDIYLMPSRFEPCGLNQMYSMAYGTVPVVHTTGGLRDTVTDQTGFRFDNPDAAGLLWATEQAISRYRYKPNAWKRTMLAGMQADFSWDRPAQQYLSLYREIGAR